MLNPYKKLSLVLLFLLLTACSSHSEMIRHFERHEAQFNELVAKYQEYTQRLHQGNYSGSERLDLEREIQQLKDELGIREVATLGGLTGTYLSTKPGNFRSTSSSDYAYITSPLDSREFLVRRSLINGTTRLCGSKACFQALRDNWYIVIPGGTHY